MPLRPARASGCPQEASVSLTPENRQAAETPQPKRRQKPEQEEYQEERFVFLFFEFLGGSYIECSDEGAILDIYREGVNYASRKPQLTQRHNILIFILL